MYLARFALVVAAVVIGLDSVGTELSTVDEVVTAVSIGIVEEGVCRQWRVAGVITVRLALAVDWLCAVRA